MTCEKLTLLVTWITLSQVLPAEAEGVFPSFKGWWGHRIDDDVFAGGRLTPRMIKYADEAGYKSIITLLAFGDNVLLGDEQFVSTDEEEQIATTMTDLKVKPVNTKHLYKIYTMLDQRRRRWADVVLILYKCFEFTGKLAAIDNSYLINVESTSLTCIQR